MTRLLFARFVSGIIAHLIPACAFTAIAQTGPSFDCHKAHSQVEQTICASPSLSSSDLQLADLYATKRQTLKTDEFVQVQNSQRDWMQARSSICATRSASESCLAKLYTARIGELKSADPVELATYWVAESNTATSVTGDVLLSRDNIFLSNAAELKLLLVKNLPQTHALDDSSFDEAVTLQLFKVQNPQPVKLISANELCSAGVPATYLVIAHNPPAGRIGIAVFSGGSEPRWDKSFLSNTTTLCGTYGYARPLKKSP
jgi:uncharacterized protein